MCFKALCHTDELQRKNINSGGEDSRCQFREADPSYHRTDQAAALQLGRTQSEGHHLTTVTPEPEGTV